MKKFLIAGLLVLTNAICFAQTLKTERLDSLFQILDKYNKFMGAINISQNGKLLYAKAVGYSDADNLKQATVTTRYRVGSISKMFTAVLILKAIEEEKVSLNQLLSEYYPGVENSNSITIGNLSSHKSGLHDFTNDKNYLSYNTESKSEKQMIEIIANGKSDFEPGSKVEYSNSNYIVLSYILEKVYKKSYATILKAKIITPLKLKDTYFGSKIQAENNEGYAYHFTDKWIKGTEKDLSIPMGAGGIVSNTTDLNYFIQELFNGKII